MNDYYVFRQRNFRGSMTQSQWKDASRRQMRVHRPLLIINNYKSGTYIHSEDQLLNLKYGATKLDN